MRLITEKIILKSPYRDYYTGAVIKTSLKDKMFDTQDSSSLDEDDVSRKNIRFVIRWQRTFVHCVYPSILSADLTLSADHLFCKSYYSCMTTHILFFLSKLLKFKPFLNSNPYQNQVFVLILTNLSQYKRLNFVVFYLEKQNYKNFIFFV